MFNVLLQGLDHGRMTDDQDRTVDFKDTVIVMSGNLGSQTIQSMAGDDYQVVDLAVMAEVKSYSRPDASPWLKPGSRPQAFVDEGHRDADDEGQHGQAQEQRQVPAQQHKEPREQDDAGSGDHPSGPRGIGQRAGQQHH